MKTASFFFAVFFLLLSVGSAYAQVSNSFEGTYYTTANNQNISMQIMPYEDGIVGQIVMGNETAEFLGTLQGNESYGLLQETSSGDVSAYHAVVRGSRLDFTISIVDPSTYQTSDVTLNFNRGTAPVHTNTATTQPAIKNHTQTSNNGGSNSATARQWRDLLSDTRLTYMSSYSSGYGDSYGGYSVKRSMDLCSQGILYLRRQQQFQCQCPGASAYNAGNSVFYSNIRLCFLGLQSEGRSNNLSSILKQKKTSN
ncbi:MAG: hypothetical protein IPM47_18800 [Sphingobacteriales bacterium]|nr:MAG: hypothetical protein IPM47_18800 [Sphingobacteriales bacterium]